MDGVGKAGGNSSLEILVACFGGQKRAPLMTPPHFSKLGVLCNWDIFGYISQYVVMYPHFTYVEIWY